MTEKLGATGKFPNGKLNKHDEGQLKLSISHDKGNVIVQFGTQVSWLGIPPADARSFAALLIRHAEAAERGL